MKFACKNEAGIETSYLVLIGSKTVSRRDRPYTVGDIVPLVDEKGKVRGQLRIVASDDDKEWSEKNLKTLNDFTEEAGREGFKTWIGLQNALAGFYGNKPLYRIEWRKTELE